MSVKALIVAILLPMSVMAQGFAGLGTSTDEFANPQRGYVFDFSNDRAAHPDFRIEWWYLTANLTGEDGTEYGLQWTLFRSALAPHDMAGWNSSQLWMGHAAVTTPERHFVAERLARGGIGQAGVVAEPFEAWIDDWQLSDSALTASGPEFRYDLKLTSQGPRVFHGENGYSTKSDQGHASYYYSEPYLRLDGKLILPEGEVSVSGSAWLDREWSSQPLSDTQNGWDWFSLSFDDGAKMMGFQLRNDDGSNYSSGTWITPDGVAEPFTDGALLATPIETTQVAGGVVPTRWHVELKTRGVDVTVSALNPNSWMATSIPYWEGPVRVEGSHTGRGYLEMTGYERK